MNILLVPFIVISLLIIVSDAKSKLYLEKKAFKDWLISKTASIIHFLLFT